MKVFVLEKMGPPFFQTLNSNSKIQLSYNESTSQEELKKRISEFEVLVIRGKNQITSEILNEAHHLKLIIRAGVGLDNIDVEGAQKRGISVKNLPHANSNATAEHTLFLIFSLLKNAKELFLAENSKSWIRGKFLSQELSHKVVGIIGFGTIGQALYKKLKPLAKEVLVCDLFQKSFEGVPRDSILKLNEILPQTDILSLHVPLNEDTKNLLTYSEIEKMKPGSFIVNCSRGRILDEADLNDAIRGGHLAGAALDVMEEEPFSFKSPLHSHPNVIITQHVASKSIQAQEMIERETVYLILEYLKKNSGE